MSNLPRTALFLVAVMSLGTAVSAQSLAGGAHHTVASVDGVPWTWGNNGIGQLADGTTTDKRAPALLTSLSPLREVTAGNVHTVFLTDDGQVYTAGSNQYWQLGLGASPAPPLNVPRLVAGVSGMVHVAAGIYHTLALTNDGTVFAWGLNNDGQLGDGTRTQRASPVLAMTGVVAIAAGGYHSMALTAAGQLWVWGTTVARSSVMARPPIDSCRPRSRVSVA
jgi:hypothetical protein